MVVVLPAPLGPSSPSTSPGSTSKLTPEMASVRPNRRLTPLTWTPAVTRGASSGPVAGGFCSDPLGVGDAGRDRCLDDERLRRVLPAHDREAVVGGRFGVDRLVVVGAGEAGERVVVEVVQPCHEALARQVGTHRFRGPLELQPDAPSFRRPLMQVTRYPARLVLL